MRGRIGILALQGDFAEHAASLKRLGVETSLVALPEELEEVSGLVIPGGESTTFIRLMEESGLDVALKKAALSGMPILATCGGMIILAREVVGGDFAPLGILNIGVRRNAYGRQIESFEVELSAPIFDPPSFPGIFIRAPKIIWVGERVEIISELPGGEPAGVKQGRIVALAFHPELTEDLRFHSLFLSLVEEYLEGGRGDAQSRGG